MVPGRSPTSITPSRLSCSQGAAGAASSAVNARALEEGEGGRRARQGERFTQETTAPSQPQSNGISDLPVGTTRASLQLSGSCASPSKDRERTACWAAKVGMATVSDIRVSRMCSRDGGMYSSADSSQFLPSRSGNLTENLH